jgi:prepilin signal peptidase PulO-like enzyme (type II secretory pathway)
LGGGDIVLVGALGLWCPPVTAALGVAIGAALTLVLGLLARARRHTRLPFAPGLAAGFILAFIVDRVS